MPPGRTLHLETNERTLNIRFGQLRSLQPLDFLFPGHHLRRTGARRKTGDEFVQLGDFLFALIVAGFNARPDLGFREHHLVIAAGVRDDGLVVDVGRVSADVIEEMPVVRDHDEAAFDYQTVITYTGGYD